MIVAAWKLRSARGLVATLGLVWIFAYPAICIQIRDAVRADYAAVLGEIHPLSLVTHNNLARIWSPQIWYQWCWQQLDFIFA